MRHQIAALALGSLLLFAAGPPALAKEATHRFSGEIARVDAVARTLLVNHKATNEKTFSLASDVKVMAGPKASSLEALKPGDRVTVTYVEQEGKLRAEEIQVAAPKTAKANGTKRGAAY